MRFEGEGEGVGGYGYELLIAERSQIHKRTCRGLMNFWSRTCRVPVFDIGCLQAVLSSSLTGEASGSYKTQVYRGERNRIRFQYVLGSRK